MAATARKMETEVAAKSKKKNLRVIKGGKDNGPIKKSPPSGKKISGVDKDKKGWVGKLNEWRTVLRLPNKLAKQLKDAAKNNGSSINEVLKTLIEVWVKQERC
jgi:hypothetical protein